MIYRFQDFELDTELFELRLRGKVCPIEPQVFNLLEYLISNRERVVSKQELHDVLWPDRFVAETTLSSRLKAARKAIGDSGKSQLLIRTMHGRGFRFLGDVEETVSGELVASSPSIRDTPGPKSTQNIRYCATRDGIPIAWSAIGSGPVLIRVLGWFTHLQMEWEWPLLRRFWERLSERLTIVRYDGRGIGLSGAFDDDFSEGTRQLDLQAVVDALGAESVSLMGISEGGWTGAQYALENQEKIDRLVFYGAYARGALARPSFDPEEDEAMTTLIRKGWGRDTPQFRQLFTYAFFPPDGDPVDIAHFNELQRISANPDTAARYVQASHRRGDGREMFARIRAPSIVIHQQNDRVVEFEEGRELAAAIPGAQFVPLPGSGHYFPFEPSTGEAVAQSIFRFFGVESAEDP